MKIVDKRGAKRTKLHTKICVWCGEEFGTYRNTRKLCSLECKSAHNGKLKLNGEYRDCKSCGEKFWAKKSEDRRGSIRQYCARSCWFKNKKLGLPVGEYLSSDGYIVVSTVGDSRKQIKKHRLIMEEHLGRVLLLNEIVHHINEDKLDNRLSNLMVCSRAEHNRIHKLLNRSKSYEKESPKESTSQTDCQKGSPDGETPPSSQK